MLQDTHPQERKQVNQQPPNYQLIMNSQRVPQSPANRNIPISVINILQSNKPVMRDNTPMSNGQMICSTISSPMSPLTLNVGSPMYSLPSSPNTPNYSPAISPAPKDRVLSPYSTPQSLSPAGSYQTYSPSRLLSPTGVMQGYDPYLTHKLQTSPEFMIQPNDMLLDSNIPLPSTDFWPDSDIFSNQSTSDLLIAFDDVKLV